MSKYLPKSPLWRRTAVAAAAGLLLATGAAYAQSNATGTIYGKVESGSTVLIENKGTGLKRTLTPDANGRFNATALPTGVYKATLMRNGAVAGSQDGIEVLLGQGAEVAFGATTSLQSVQVVGQLKRIDVSNTNNGSTFTAKELASIPAVTNVNSIIQLAPNTTRADSRYAGGASMGGGAPSENSYYINGFPVTNALTQLGGSELPFGAIGQAQVLTGGFGAEFGRSVGGVVNIVTKSGTNSWEGGVQYSIDPNALRAKSVDLYYGTTGDVANANTDGTLRARRSENTSTRQQLGAYISGPLIEDKLFMFVAVEQTNTDNGRVSGLRTSTTNGSNGWVDEQFKTQRYLGKFDWNLTNDHRLEWTTIGDTPTQSQAFSGYDYATNARTGPVTSSNYYQNIDNQTAQGAKVNIFKYTGELTPDLTLTALYGQSKSEHSNDFAGFSPSQHGVTFGNSITSKAPGVTYPVLNPISNQQIIGQGSQDEVKGSRFDLEYRLQKHTLRAGVDNNRLSSAGAGVTLSGGKNILYTKRTAGGSSAFAVPSSGGQLWNMLDPRFGALAAQGFYGQETIFITTTDAYSDQAAQYIEDKFQVTKNLQVTAGLRHETYENRNGDNQVFLKSEQVNPRFSAAWDVNGDSSLKVYGSAGRYSLQIPTHIAVRGASRSTFTRQVFSYTGVDANGSPIGRVNATNAYSSNNEYGQQKEYQSVSSTDLKPTNQDEITLGFEKALTPKFNGGTKVTYRKLQGTIDDFCDARPFNTFAEKKGIDTSNYGGFGCASINPGLDNSFLIDFNNANPDVSKRGKFTRVDLTAADIGLPSAERTYFAVDFFLEHPLRDGWYGKVNYTYSKSMGNTEGQTNSDTAQTDVAATAVWDQPELMERAYGRLPGDRTHQIKAFGFVDLNAEWQVGANLLLASGRPTNCIGFYSGPSTTLVDDYGSAYHYCNGKAAPRGESGDLPWDKRLDLSVAYKPASMKGLQFKADVINVLNDQIVQTVEEQYQDNATGNIFANYGRTISTTAPRSIRLTATYNYKF